MCVCKLQQSLFLFFFQCKVANQQSYFGAEVLPGEALSVTAGGLMAVPCSSSCRAGMEGEEREKSLGSSETKGSAVCSPVGLPIPSPKELSRRCWLTLPGAAVLVPTWPPVKWVISCTGVHWKVSLCSRGGFQLLFPLPRRQRNESGKFSVLPHLLRETRTS